MHRAIEKMLTWPAAEQALRLRNCRELWTPEVARALLRSAYKLRFRDPDELLRLSELAYEVAARLPDGAARSDVTAEALCSLSNGHKITGRYNLAEGAIAAAYRAEQMGSGAPTLRALRLETLASLRIRQMRTSEARVLLTETASIREAQGDSTAIAVSLIQRTLLACEGDAPPLEGLRDTRRAAELLEPKREPLLSLLARHNGLWLLCKMGRGVDASEVFRAVQPLYQAVDEPVMRLRQGWIAALIEGTLGRHERSAEGFGKLVESLLAIPQPYDAAWAALEQGRELAAAGMNYRSALDRGMAILGALGIGERSETARLLRETKGGAAEIEQTAAILRRQGLRYGLQAP